ncbi:MAG: 50S ribosomal protein L19 [Patescibacteria group bacterium]
MTDAIETTEITDAPAAVVTPTVVETGMVIRLHEKIQDVNAKGEPRERIQIFEGLVTGTRGAGASKSFVVRKESNGFGVEKIFPTSSPVIVKIEVVKRYKVRKRKLNFMKDFGRKLRELVVKK